VKSLTELAMSGKVESLFLSTDSNLSYGEQSRSGASQSVPDLAITIAMRERVAEVLAKTKSINIYVYFSSLFILHSFGSRAENSLF
jgi:hypothetical protein